MPFNPEETHTDPQELRTGVLLVNEGFVRMEDVKTALEIQHRETLQSTARTKAHPRTIGEILCDLNLITPADLGAVLKKYRKNLNLEQILIKQGSADPKTLAAALRTEENGTEPGGNILLQKGIITETQLYEAYSLQHNLPYMPFDAFTFTPEDSAALSGIIGKDFACRFGVLPVTLGRKRLGVVVSDPGKLKVIDALRIKQTDLRIECAFVTASTFDRLFNLLYEKESAGPRSEAAEPLRPREDTRAGISASEPEPQRDALTSSGTSVYTETISDPEAQREAVVRLHAAYERLAIARGLRTVPSDPHIFGKFIQRHFYQICHKYRCRRVSFRILDRQPQIIITAMPVQPFD